MHRTLPFPFPTRMLLTLTLWAALLTGSMMAQSTGAEQADWVNSQYSRIDDLSEITDGGVYLIVSADPDKPYLMGAALDANNKTKLQGLKYTLDNKGKLSIKKADRVWRIRQVGEGRVALVAAVTGKTLTRKKAGSLGLTWGDGQTALTQWTLIQTGEGTFRLLDPDATNRGIRLGQSSPTHFFFDNYELSDTYHLAFYHPSEEGSADMPGDGARVALCNSGRVLAANGAGIASEAYELTDGLLAPADEVAAWQCRHTGASTFTLHSAEGYMGYDLRPTPTATDWRYAAGRIMTTEDSPRRLAYDPAIGNWVLTTPSSNLPDAGFVTLAAEPSRSLTPQGGCTLHGGWSADALAALDMGDVKYLDLTGIALPCHMRSFSTDLTTRNMPIFVTEGVTGSIPASWRFVVSVGTTNRLLRQTELLDGVPFYSDRPFRVREGQLTYERRVPADANWLTSCLPFTLSLRSGTAYHVRGVSGEAIVVSEEISLQAGMPYLLCVEPGSTLSFSSLEGDIAISPWSDETLCGTYVGMTVGEGDSPTYMLHPTDQAFRRAAAGSRLAPFRACLPLPSSWGAAPLRLKLPRP